MECAVRRSCIWISNCEIGWIGGSSQYYFYDTGIPIRLGYGVEFNGCFVRFSVTDCYIYHCWDVGVSNQDLMESEEVTGRDGPSYDENAIHRNVTYARNVIKYTSIPVEIFLVPEDDAGYSRHYIENALITDNYILYTGYGWSTTDLRNRVLVMNAPHMGHNYPNTVENFQIQNNIFYFSTGPLLCTKASQDFLLVFNGNTYT